ncbi:aminoacyl-tRNA hydrolase [candidate division WWE3 bacterium CG10_big_fil_rev_8_21_14_0_10_32_10]|uniref:Peptidyl-tRNA hydrolase n=1 Tax=candidate division WWE3 bacterium CG10_big_fil_rev_8_21_14_0_10_32_10 TaxID=1975090 RepID=A0A2H0R9A9_UNCKA|nr:MAG: aminoacyl-tRNA hydrolase [candidate division WWE3 bacterium CG10_big_fil_rev_8_21_14_0_10_32_10]
MKAIFGLGNFDTIYNNTRHNVGFGLVDMYTKEFYSELSFSPKKSLQCTLLNAPNVIFVKPLTYMNESGSCVKKVCDYFDIKIDDIMVIHDDIDQKIGSFKYIKTGGSGGHKGIFDIIQKLNTNEFDRLKIGIAPDFYDPSKHKAEDFVLKKFSSSEINTLNNVYDMYLIALIKDFITS